MTLVKLYEAYNRAPGSVMRAYWSGRIEEHIAQNAVSRSEAGIAAREARQS